MSYPYYEDGILCRFIGDNYGVRTVEGKEGRTYAAGQAAPRQRIHRDDLALLAEHFRPLHAVENVHSLTIHTSNAVEAAEIFATTQPLTSEATNAKAKRKPDTE